eukprot:7070533-Prymnesium_polylepis.1
MADATGMKLNSNGTEEPERDLGEPGFPADEYLPVTWPSHRLQSSRTRNVGRGSWLLVRHMPTDSVSNVPGSRSPQSRTLQSTRSGKLIATRKGRTRRNPPGAPAVDRNDLDDFHSSLEDISAAAVDPGDLVGLLDDSSGDEDMPDMVYSEPSSDEDDADKPSGTPARKPECFCCEPDPDAELDDFYSTLQDIAAAAIEPSDLSDLLGVDPAETNHEEPRDVQTQDGDCGKRMCAKGAQWANACK